MKSVLTDLFDLLEQQHEDTISPEQREAIERAAPWAKRLEELMVKIPAKAGEGGRLFGAVTAKEISECLSQQHGVNIAKAKLVLDEPINGLDPVGIQELRGLIRSFPEKGITVILSSHILSEIRQTADYIGIITDGRLGFEGKAEEQEDLEGLFMKVAAKGGDRR